MSAMELMIVKMALPLMKWAVPIFQERSGVAPIMLFVSFELMAVDALDFIFIYCFKPHNCSAAVFILVGFILVRHIYHGL